MASGSQDIQFTESPSSSQTFNFTSISKLVINMEELCSSLDHSFSTSVSGSWIWSFNLVLRVSLLTTSQLQWCGKDTSVWLCTSFSSKMQSTFTKTGMTLQTTFSILRKMINRNEKSIEIRKIKRNNYLCTHRQRTTHQRKEEDERDPAQLSVKVY